MHSAARERQKKQQELIGAHIDKDEDEDKLLTKFGNDKRYGKIKLVKYFLKLFPRKKRKHKKGKKEKVDETAEEEDLEDEFDWWTKYYNSMNPLVRFLFFLNTTVLL